MNVYNFTYGSATEIKEIEVYALDEKEAKDKFINKTGESNFQFEFLGICEDFDKNKLESELKKEYKESNYENYVIL